MSADRSMSTGASQPVDRPARVPARWSRQWLVLLLPAGFLLGIIGGFMQEHRVTVGPLTIPWAAVLIIATLVVTIRALSLNIATRAAGVAFFLGWLIASALLAVPNPSGDIVFANDIAAMAYLMSGCVLGGAAAFWPLFLDIGSPDTGSADARFLDTGSPATRSLDTGSPDAGASDTASPDTASPDTSPLAAGADDADRPQA